MQDTNKIHNLILEGRNKLTLSGITDVDSFDEKTVVLFTHMGELTVCGKNLHVNEISVETGDMSIEGDIWSLSYGDKDRRSSVSFLGKLFR
ncbi:MAG: sporulation protein YabP [Ruminococcus sp.]|nr:sporulation protein YabP [Ruminococcus sp.]